MVSSMTTTDLPESSWPVTTLRTPCFMARSPLVFRSTSCPTEKARVYGTRPPPQRYAWHDAASGFRRQPKEKKTPRERCSVHRGWNWIKNVSFEPGIPVGDTIWVSGQVALDPDGLLVGAGDMRAQCDLTFKNVAEVLAVGGATMDDVVKIMAWVTTMENYATYNEARGAAFPSNQSANACVLSPELAFSGLLMEVEGAAVVGSG